MSGGDDFIGGKCSGFEISKPDPSQQFKSHYNIEGKVKVGLMKKYRLFLRHTVFQDEHEDIYARVYKINRAHFDLVDITQISEKEIENIRAKIDELKIKEYVKKEALEQIMQQPSNKNM